jgi:hypothetical protein
MKIAKRKGRVWPILSKMSVYADVGLPLARCMSENDQATALGLPPFRFDSGGGVKSGMKSAVAHGAASFGKHQKLGCYPPRPA